MAELNTVQLPLDPEYLWICQVDVFRDEEFRTWVPVVIQTENCLLVLWYQEDVPVGHVLSASQMTSYPVPWMWGLLPGKVYQCSGGMFWRIVYHIKYREVEKMLLERL